MGVWRLPLEVQGYVCLQSHLPDLLSVRLISVLQGELPGDSWTPWTQGLQRTEGKRPKNPWPMLQEARDLPEFHTEGQLTVDGTSKLGAPKLQILSISF